eukprot:gene32492-36683_t
MAPELIAAKRHYTEAIDIYALAVTLWEIWTGKDPYEDISQFDIYAKVAEGYRPALPDNAPPGFNDLLKAAWQEDPVLRPDASDLLAQVEDVYRAYTGQAVPVVEVELAVRPTLFRNNSKQVSVDSQGNVAKRVSKDTLATADSTVDLESGLAKSVDPSFTQNVVTTSSSEVNPLHARASAVPSSPSRRHESTSSAGSSRPTSGISSVSAQSDIELATVSRSAAAVVTAPAGSSAAADSSNRDTPTGANSSTNNPETTQ